MSFISVGLDGTSTRQGISRPVPPLGDPSSAIALIGEAPGEYEDKMGVPFVGPAGTVLEQCLHGAGLTKRDCYILNYLPLRPKNNNINPWFSIKTRTFSEQGWEEVLALRDRLQLFTGNVLVPLGNVAFAALTYRDKNDRGAGIMDARGYFTTTPDGRKVLPTVHPSAALRGQYMLRYIISWDLKKAREHSDTPTLTRPTRHLDYSNSFHSVVEKLRALISAPVLSVDIEVHNFEVSCICFAPSPEYSLSIPLDHRWTENEELAIWRLIAAILQNPRIDKVMQNGIFDTQFLAARMGIFVRGRIIDTMIRHHLQYPDMKKGLGFLISLYGGTSEYHKDMVRFDNIKKES
jgi:uracil-DNA glycosylase